MVHVVGGDQECGRQDKAIRRVLGNPRGSLAIGRTLTGADANRQPSRGPCGVSAREEGSGERSGRGSRVPGRRGLQAA
jgi:hypothetical protein